MTSNCNGPSENMDAGIVRTLKVDLAGFSHNLVNSSRHYEAASRNRLDDPSTTTESYDLGKNVLFCLCFSTFNKLDITGAVHRSLLPQPSAYKLILSISRPSRCRRWESEKAQYGRWAPVTTSLNTCNTHPWHAWQVGVLACFFLSTGLYLMLHAVTNFEASMSGRVGKWTNMGTRKGAICTVSAYLEYRHPTLIHDTL